MFSFDRPKGQSARTPPPTLLFSLHLSKNRCLTQRHQNNLGPPRPSLARRARPQSQAAKPSFKNLAADETDLVSVASAVNRLRESFSKLSRRCSWSLTSKDQASPFAETLPL